MIELSLSNITNQFNHDIDLFITSASFEQRCFGISTEVLRMRPKNTLVFFNSNEYEEIRRNAKKIYSNFKEVSSVRMIELNSKEPNHNALNISSTLNVALKNNSHVFCDITTFTHETLLILFNLLYKRRRYIKSLKTGYLGAKSYSFKQPNYSKKWLSKGIREIRTIIGFPGRFNPARKSHLILLLGFEEERARTIIESLRLNSFSLGFAEQNNSVAKEHFNVNFDRHERLLRLFPHAQKFTFSALDPILTRDRLMKHLDLFPDHNIVIAPMNNKVSTIGAGLLAMEDRRVQLIYAQATLYNVSGYSEPGSIVHVNDLTGFYNRIE